MSVPGLGRAKTPERLERVRAGIQPARLARSEPVSCTSDN
jgi:hypothetical protein